jgi:S-methyl-5-thioribose-1-phosphate isomerase
MKVDGKHYRSIWVATDGWSVEVIDQTALPHAFAIARLTTLADAAEAIRTMKVRGAPLIGATAAYGLCLALRADPSDETLDRAHATLLATRPTAVNLRWALDDMRDHLRNRRRDERVAAAYARAAAICDDDVATCAAIGRHGLPLIQAAWDRAGRGRPVDVLTHCNAGWLATVDWGTALAPIYRAHDAGIPVHVWVDETRPRNQGAALTAWELGRHGVPHTVIVDNAGGHLMQHGAGRRVQQDRHLSQGAGGARQRRAVLCRAAPFDDRLDDRGRRRHSDRGARSGRGRDRRRHRQRRPAAGGVDRAGRQPRRELRLRRDAGAPRDRVHHRARHSAGQPRGPSVAVSRARRHGVRHRVGLETRAGHARISGSGRRRL